MEAHQAVFICLLFVAKCVLGQDNDTTIDKTQCHTNDECPKDRTCMNMECKNPCTEVCKGNTTCQVHDHVSFCVCKHGFSGDPFFGCDQQLMTDHNICKTDEECPGNQGCIDEECKDPCLNFCKISNTYCRVRHHVPHCYCNPGFSGDPLTNCTHKYFPGSWPPFPGAKKRYHVENIKTNWFGAFTHCMNHGGRLATIENSDENEKIKQEIRKSNLKPQFWVSGTDYALGNQWAWMSTGTAFSFSDWSDRQPDNWQKMAGGEHCLELWEAGNYRWNDRNCLEEQYSICEYYD